jgi:hypothetical protein
VVFETPITNIVFAVGITIIGNAICILPFYLAYKLVKRILKYVSDYTDRRTTKTSSTE